MQGSRAAGQSFPSLDWTKGLTARGRGRNRMLLWSHILSPSACSVLCRLDSLSVTPLHWPTSDSWTYTVQPSDSWKHTVQPSDSWTYTVQPFGQVHAHCPTIRQLEIHCLNNRLLVMHFTILGQLDINCPIIVHVKFQIFKQLEICCSSVRHLEKILLVNILCTWQILPHSINSICPKQGILSESVACSACHFRDPCQPG